MGYRDSTHRNEAQRRWREANPEKVRAAQAKYHATHGDARRAKNREWHRRRREAAYVLINARKREGCEQCGLKHECMAVFDLDHRNPEQKLFALSDSLASRTLDEVAAELEKCAVLCANCHRVRTYNEKHCLLRKH